MNKDTFLKRKFLYDVQVPAAGFCSLGLWFVIGQFLLVFFKCSDDFGVVFMLASPFLIFGIYNFFTYVWSKRMADRYGIDMFGDLDQKWLIEYQGYDSKVFGEIYSKLLYFRKLGAYSLFITIPLPLTPWPAIPLIVGIIMIALYTIYKHVYFYQAQGDKWPRVFAGGVVVSRILNSEKGYNNSGKGKENDSEK